MTALKFDISGFARMPEFPLHIATNTLKSPYPEHQHNFWELVIIWKGESRHLILGREFSAQAGDVYVIRENQMHAFPKTNSMLLTNIMFMPSYFEPLTRELRRLKGYQSLFALEPSLRGDRVNEIQLKLNADKLKDLKQSVDLMEKEYLENKAGMSSMLSGYFLQIMTLLSREAEIFSAGKNSDTHKIAAALAWMEVNYTKKFSIKDLAEKSGFSHRHFNRIFAKIHGVSPMRYLIDKKLSFAAGLLEQYGNKILETAYASGFEDARHFTKMFRLKYRVSPRDYKKAGRHNL